MIRFFGYPPGAMSFKPRALALRGYALLAPFLLAALLGSAPAAAQTFAVGGGGSLTADQGSQVADSGFSQWGGFVFGELALGGFHDRQAGVFQLRFSYSSLPGGAPDAPKVEAWSGLALVSYRFQENWWEAGLVGGVGAFRILPKAPEPGQVPADPTQTVIGFAVGAQTLFRVSEKFDVRLELLGEFPNTDYSHTLIVLTTAVGYRF
jgi:hypothetical protein